jgi:hypothetical protein
LRRSASRYSLRERREAGTQEVPGLRAADSFA